MSDVIGLRPNLSPTDRMAAIMEAIDDCIRAAEDMAEEHPLEMMCWMMQLTKSCTELALLESRMQAKRGMVELAGRFGRAP